VLNAEPTVLGSPSNCVGSSCHDFPSDEKSIFSASSGTTMTTLPEVVT
jgi:hypothetical protein